MCFAKVSISKSERGTTGGPPPGPWILLGRLEFELVKETIGKSGVFIIYEKVFSSDWAAVSGLSADYESQCSSSITSQITKDKHINNV